MGAEQSTLQFLRRSVSSDDNPSSSNIIGSSRELHEHPRIQNTSGDGTSSTTTPSEDVPHRMNTGLNDEMHYSCIDNNDNQGLSDRWFISVELISNCQEESEIQQEDSSIDNNSNVSETTIQSNTEISNTSSGLTSNLQPNDIMEEGQVIIQLL
ncbi:unnamed protein product [Caenorhabditis nigoni]